ncbi:hypothetical protein GQ42DRAFT_152803 [Ramicandelaber brevisporus]|nr:hypothetical protein GQ42DRAFT_152803 [Ramicandelaber brevisporus]
MTTIESGSNGCSCCRDGAHHSHQHDSTADQSQLPKHDIKSEMLGTVRGLAQRSLQPFWNSVSASQFHIVLMDLIPVRLSKLGLQTGNYPLDIRIVSVIATLTMSALNALSAVMWYVWDWLTTPKKQPLFEVSSNASDDGSAQPKDIQPTFMAKVKMAAAATVGWKVAVDSKDSKKKKNKQKKSKKMDIVDEKTIKSEQQPLLTPEQQQQQQQQNKQHKQTQTQQNLMHKIGVAVQHMSTGNIDNNLATSQVHESLTWLITNSVMKLNYGKFTLISENEYYDMNQGRAPRFDLIPDVGSAPIELQPIDDPREFLLDNLRSKAAAALENEDVDATALTEQFVTSTKESAQVATNRRDIIAKEATTNAKKPFIVHFREGTDIKVNYDDDGGGCMCSECRGDNDEEEDTSRNIASRPTYLVETSRGDDRTVGDVQQFLHNVVQANKYSNRYDMRRRVYYFKQYTWTDTDGNWQTIRYLDDTNGGLDSVALDREQEHVLKEDLENFENDRDFYLRNGLPYRRAYLLHGRPGCGKTSLANALANHLKRLVFGNGADCVGLWNSEEKANHCV